MATVYGTSWTATYQGNSRTFRLYCTYTFTANYSATKSRLVINEIGIQKTSSGATEFTSASTSYITASFNGTSKKFSKGSSSYKFDSDANSTKKYGGSSSTYFEVSKTSSSRTLTLSLSGGQQDGAWEGNSTKSVSFTIPALQPVTITFNANGGSGTPPSTISTYSGVNNTIPANSLTRTAFYFSGWNTRSDGTGTTYQTGATISFTSNTTLYAKWVRNYVAPILTEIVAYRVADTYSPSQSNPTVVSDGTRLFFKVKYTSGSHYTISSKIVVFKNASDAEIERVTLSSSGGYYFGYSSSNAYDATKSFYVQGLFGLRLEDGVTITVGDAVTYISPSLNAIDVAQGSDSSGSCFNIAFGGNATEDYSNHGKFDCYMDAEFKNIARFLSGANISGGNLNCSVPANFDSPITYNGIKAGEDHSGRFEFGRLRIQWGRASVSLSSGASYGTKNISYSEFKYIPTLITDIEGRYYGETFSTSLAKSSAAVGWKPDTAPTSAITRNVRWIAIGIIT